MLFRLPKKHGMKKPTKDSKNSVIHFDPPSLIGMDTDLICPTDDLVALADEAEWSWFSPKIMFWVMQQFPNLSTVSVNACSVQPTALQSQSTDAEPNVENLSHACITHHSWQDSNLIAVLPQQTRDLRSRSARHLCHGSCTCSTLRLRSAGCHHALTAYFSTLGFRLSVRLLPKPPGARCLRQPRAT